MSNKKIYLFNELYQKYYKQSFLFAKSYTHDTMVAEEIASDALFCMWDKMQKEEILYPKSFLSAIIKNKSLDYLKHQKVHKKLFESFDDWEIQDISIRLSCLNSYNYDEASSTELQKLIEDTINALPFKTRQVFILSRYEFFTGKKISSHLGISEKGVEYHISKALKILTIKLKDYLIIFLF